MNIKETIKSALNTVKETTQKLAEKRNLKIKDIVKIPEFQKLLVMEESVVEKMKASMREEGFKSGHEVHVWKHDGQYILIDGHTRLFSWESLGNKTIPCIVHYFATMEEAKEFAIKEQVNRRNLSGQALLEAVQNFNFEKGKGNVSGEKGKSSEIIAKQIGVSAKTVEKTRVVLKEGTPDQLEAIKKDELSMNQVFNQIQEKKKAEKEASDSPSSTDATSSPESDSTSTKGKTNVSKTEKKAAAAKTKQTTEKTFEDGVRFAIRQIKKGVT
ncbi:ParB/RepB/Spo0J family partition protein, partial [Treponema sp.]|uniref:ParB/RepB/Spo0J family partition protein n=1 Tax=Treponema sp. TaxID=166 RepID=UPI002A82C1B0